MPRRDQPTSTPTSLVDSLNTVRSSYKGPYCTIGTLLQTLPDAEAQALQGVIERMVAGETIGAQATRVLREAGHQVGAGAIQRHARGECRCNRVVDKGL